MDKTKYVDIVFDGPPSHESGRFVEVENDKRASISVGEWVKPEPGTEDGMHGFWRLRIPCDEFFDMDLLAANIHAISTSKGFSAPSMENLASKLMLSVSELAEAMEEHRSHKPLVYFKCPQCGAEREAAPSGDGSHFIPRRGIVAYLLERLGKKDNMIQCPGKITKPEGILVEIADSNIRNLHMMHALIEEHKREHPGIDYPWRVSDVHEIKVDYNSDRPHMHGGRSY